MTATPSCPACGADVRPGWLYCAACGQRVAPAEALERRTLGFVFHGTAREYFGVWIVNLLLSLVTLGIYTAWAKVRRLRYFYGNTTLDGHGFDYHARPTRILLGRVIVVAIIGGYNLLVNLNPAFALLSLGYLALLPWAINLSLGFNARMTSYRNIRFSFRGSYWSALGIFALLPLTIGFTLGLTLPVFSRLAARYVGNGLRYGSAPFRTEPPLGRYFANFWLSVLLTIGLFAVIGTLVWLAAAFLPEDGSRKSAIFVAIAGFYVTLIPVAVFYRAGSRNIAYNATTLRGGHRLGSSLSRPRMLWIGISNLAATLISLGLLRPWAAVRTWRYTAEHTSLDAAGSLEDFGVELDASGNVIAAEFAAIEGVDLGL